MQILKDNGRGTREETLLNFFTSFCILKSQSPSPFNCQRSLRLWRAWGAAQRALRLENEKVRNGQKGAEGALRATATA